MKSMLEFLADLKNLAYTCCVVLVLAIMLGCCSSGERNEEPKTTELKTEWRLVGKQGNCSLYYKCVQTNGMSCSNVFWSVCHNGSGSSASVSK